MNYMEDFSDYINYEACETNDARSKAQPITQESIQLEETIFLTLPEFDFLGQWPNTFVPASISTYNQDTSKPDFRDSGLFSDPSGWNSSQPILFSVDPLDISSSTLTTCSPSTAHSLALPDNIESDNSNHSRASIPSSYSPSISSSDSDESSPSRSSSPFSDSPSPPASDSDESDLLSHNVSIAGTPVPTLSSLSEDRRSFSPRLHHSPSPSPIMEYGHLSACSETTRPITRGVKQKLKDARKRRQASPLPTQQGCTAVSSKDIADQEPTCLDLSPNPFILDKNGKKRWLCFCGKSFTRDSDRKRHFKDSTSCPLARKGLEERQEKLDPQFACDLCGKPFSRYDSMDRHRRNPTACPGVPKPNLGRKRGKQRTTRRCGDNNE